MPRRSVLTPSRIGASSVRIQQIHRPDRGVLRIGHCGLVDLGARPPEVIPDLVGNVHEATNDRESTVRSVNDPSHEMRMSEDCHEAAGGQPRCRPPLTKNARGFTTPSSSALTKTVRRRQIRQPANRVRSTQEVRRFWTLGTSDTWTAWRVVRYRRRIRIVCSAPARSLLVLRLSAPSGWCATDRLRCRPG